MQHSYSLHLYYKKKYVTCSYVNTIFNFLLVSPNQLKTLCVNCEGAINALDTSKDNSQVVVAGRNGRWMY